MISTAAWKRDGRSEQKSRLLPERNALSSLERNSTCQVAAAWSDHRRSINHRIIRRLDSLIDASSKANHASQRIMPLYKLAEAMLQQHCSRVHKTHSRVRAEIHSYLRKHTYLHTFESYIYAYKYIHAWLRIQHTQTGKHVYLCVQTSTYKYTHTLYRHVN